MSVGTVLCEIEAAGIAFRLDGERVRICFPEPQERERLAQQVAFLRAHRDEVAAFLRRREEGSKGRAPDFWGKGLNGKPRDYYGWRAHVAVDAILGISAPEGLSVWLNKHSPYLYQRLIDVLPTKISRAWDDRVPYEEFDALCFELVDTWLRAAELYRATAEARKE